MLYPGLLKRLADGLSLRNVSLSQKGHSFFGLLGLVACSRIPFRVTRSKLSALLSLYFPAVKSTQFYPRATWTLRGSHYGWCRSETPASLPFSLYFSIKGDDHVKRTLTR